MATMPEQALDILPRCYADLFQARGFKLISREKPSDSISARRNAEELFLFQKEGTEKEFNQ